jgi:acetyltransferase-like isoleucine patch superfamily enzyme
MSRWGNMFGPIIIEDDCFIGVNAILLPGTTIGANSIVGAGAVVKGTFPDSSVIAGVPAKRLYSLDEYIEKVKAMMIPLQAQTREELKRELMAHFFSGIK